MGEEGTRGPTIGGAGERRRLVFDRHQRLEGEEHLATIGALEAAPDDPRGYAPPLTLSVERLAD